MELRETRIVYGPLSTPPLGDNLPTNLENYSAIVVFGSPGSINDDDEYIEKEINWLKKVIDSNVPFLGICFGAQLLAKYLGSEVKTNSKGISSRFSNKAITNETEPLNRRSFPILGPIERISFVVKSNGPIT